MVSQRDEGQWKIAENGPNLTQLATVRGSEEQALRT